MKVRCSLHDYQVVLNGNPARLAIVAWVLLTECVSPVGSGACKTVLDEQVGERCFVWFKVHLRNPQTDLPW